MIYPFTKYLVWLIIIKKENMGKPYVYKVVCIPTGNIYIGVRFGKIYINSGRTPEEDLWKYYFTSSKYVRNLIDIHGIEAFKTSVIATAENSSDAIDIEMSEIQNVWDSNLSNLSLNYSKAGKMIKKSPMSDENKLKMSELRKGRVSITDGVNYKSVKLNDIPEGWYKGSHPNIPQTGSSWVNNGIVNKKLKPNVEIPEGFINGRIMKSRYYVNNGEHNKLILLNDPVPEGYFSGYLKCSPNIGTKTKGKIWINDGVKHKRINPTDPIPGGFIIGRIIPKDEITGRIIKKIDAF